MCGSCRCATRFTQLPPRSNRSRSVPAAHMPYEIIARPPTSQSACRALYAVCAHAFHFHAQMNTLKTHSERELSRDKLNLILPSTITWDIVFIPDVYNCGERISIRRLPNISRMDDGDAIGFHPQPHLLPGCLFSSANDHNNISVGVADLGNYCHNTAH